MAQFQAGDFDKRITLRMVSEGTETVINDEGVPEEVPGSVVDKKVWAAVKPLTFREYTEARAAQVEITTRFVIRYRKGLTDSTKIIYKGAEYDIESIINDNDANVTLTLIAKAVG